MQRLIQSTLESNGLWWLARLCLVVVFVSSGLAKLIDIDGGMSEMRAAGLEPALLFNLVVAVTLLSGALLILLDRLVWLGAGALAVFLALTIIVVHTFWNLPESEATVSMFFALEHASLIGGLIATAIASHLRQQLIALSRIGAGVKS